MSGIDEMPKSVKKKMEEIPCSTMDNLLKIMRRSHTTYYFIDVETRYGTSPGVVKYFTVANIDWESINPGDFIIVDEDWGG